MHLQFTQNKTQMRFLKSELNLSYEPSEFRAGINHHWLLKPLGIFLVHMESTDLLILDVLFGNNC